jgi:cysteine-rich repeat protein
MVQADACTNACKTATCGDGLVQTGVEECDDGNHVDTDACTSTCKNAMCGDAIVQAGVEQCDDGNSVSTDGCTNACKNAACGDAIVQAGVEECDDGNSVSTDACTNTCKNAVCGDGIVEAGVEECDDGNHVDTDSCTNACKNFVVSALCGNGMMDAGEECDDGNTVNDDACSNVCTANVCGNSRVDPGEACDGTLGPSGALGPGKACAGDCKSITDTCLACESQTSTCEDWQGLGIDLVAGCYGNADPAFVQKCVDVLNCARTSADKCAYGTRGPELCYCGTLATAACSVSTAPVDGTCVAVMQKAASLTSTPATDSQYVTAHFSDRALPLGNAVDMLYCDRDNCMSPSAGCVP